MGFTASRFLKASGERRAQSVPPTSRDLTAGAPTSRTGRAADDAGNGTRADIASVREDYGGTGVYRDDSGAAR